MRRTWMFLFALLAGLIAATAFVSLSVNEPARRYMEREINPRPPVHCRVWRVKAGPERSIGVCIRLTARR